MQNTYSTLIWFLDILFEEFWNMNLKYEPQKINLNKKQRLIRKHWCSKFSKKSNLNYHPKMDWKTKNKIFEKKSQIHEKFAKETKIESFQSLL